MPEMQSSCIVRFLSVKLKAVYEVPLQVVFSLCCMLMLCDGRRYHLQCGRILSASKQGMIILRVTT